MINDAIKRQKKLDKLLKITNISDKELSKLDYKGKQQYFKAKSKLCSVVFTSRDKAGKGITYRKPNRKFAENNYKKVIQIKEESTRTIFASKGLYENT